MTFNSIADIEDRLNHLPLNALRQIGRNVGVPRFYSLPMGKLRDGILAIANGEYVPPLTYERNIKQPVLMFNQDLVDAVRTFSKINRNE